MTDHLKLPRLDGFEQDDKTDISKQKQSILVDINIPLRSDGDLSLSDHRHDTPGPDQTAYSGPVIKDFFISESPATLDVSTVAMGLKRPKRLQDKLGQPASTVKRVLSATVTAPVIG